MIYELFLDATCLSIPNRFVATSISQSLDLATPFLKLAFQGDVNLDIMLSYSEYEGIKEFFSLNAGDLEGEEYRSFLELYKKESFIVYHDCIKEEAMAYISGELEGNQGSF